MTLLEFVPQCCDASIYLKMGQQCAVQGLCYNGLRPMGAVYWFSLPYRFGLPATSLILAHYLLLGISVILSVMAANALQRKIFGIKITKRMIGVLLLCSLAIHSVFLFPVLRTTLSDAPAALFALIGTWLLMLSTEASKKRIIPKRIVTIGLAGLMLGMAAWFRAFYLYPVLIGIGLWLLVTLWRDKHSRVHLAILAAMIPIGVQYGATFNDSHQISYLDPETSASWSESHLDSTITGYDTILPFDYHTWYAPCEHYSSLLRALKTADIKSMGCVIAGRINFYLGSYSAQPYLPTFEHNHNPIPVIGDHTLLSFSDSSSISTNNILYAKNKTGDVGIFKSWKPDPHQDGKLHWSIPLERGNIYQFLVSVWSDNTLQNIDIRIIDHETQQTRAETGILIIPQEEFSRPNESIINDSITNVVIDRNGVYDIVIESQVYDENSVLGKAAKEFNRSLNTEAFYIKDIKLLKISRTEPSSRIWSTPMLIANLVAILIALTLLKVFVDQKDHFKLVTSLIPISCFAVCLVIVPEQRFVIFPLIFSWWLAIIIVTQQISKKDNNRIVSP